MRVVFVAPEGVPFSKTGGLADVIGGLPQALAELGLQVDVLLPRYRVTAQGPTLEAGRSITIPLQAGFRFASIQDGGAICGVRHYLVDVPEFFDRDGLYQDAATGADYGDNYLRFAGFSLAALEFVKRLGPAPEIIHCHDWQTGLVPVYLQRNYWSDLFYFNTRVVFTVHNLAYHPEFAREILREISLDDGVFNMDALEYYGRVNLLKGGLVFADYLTTVSPKYAEEIQTPEFGSGMEGVIRKHAGKLCGILNGCDYSAWNPATDLLIAANYTPEDLCGKKACKRALLESMGVDQPDLSKPVLGVVSRFDRQKGFDLLAEIAETLAGLDLYLLVLGSGARDYEEFFARLGKQHPGKFLVKIGYDNALAHQIEAGADIFLMPSRYEPCGLNQMYSLKYGTVPVVRGTGGLENTIENFDGNAGTGFKFYDYTGAAFLDAIGRALEAFRWPKLWTRIMVNGMGKDFSWSRSAQEYAELYRAISPVKAEPIESEKAEKPPTKDAAADSARGARP
ncbi:MAG TPA: glycogen synthase GlgA [Terriglobia bacterium]|nr:glycogen synthase GlgA [Terriglobia bacterium]